MKVRVNLGIRRILFAPDFLAERLDARQMMMMIDHLILGWELFLSSLLHESVSVP